jgi:hypothetical protein
MNKKAETLSLAEAVTHLLEECRMVLPGIQALFGFQLIAVFNNRFEDLSEPEQFMHLAALSCVAIAVALVMSPASYHRLTGSREVTDKFLWLANRLLLFSMYFLACGTALDFYIVSRLILDNRPLSAALAVGLVAVLVTLWFLLPKITDKRR